MEEEAYGLDSAVEVEHSVTEEYFSPAPSTPRSAEDGVLSTPSEKQDRASGSGGRALRALPPVPNNEEEQARAFARDAFPHADSGQANDGKIYHDDSGRMVKLDRRGHKYQVDGAGHRNTRKSARPEDIDPDTWKYLGPALRRQQQK